MRKEEKGRTTKKKEDEKKKKKTMKKQDVLLTGLYMTLHQKKSKFKISESSTLSLQEDVRRIYFLLI